MTFLICSTIWADCNLLLHKNLPPSYHDSHITNLTFSQPGNTRDKQSYCSGLVKASLNLCCAEEPQKTEMFLETSKCGQASYFPWKQGPTSAYPERSYPEHWLSCLLEKRVIHHTKHSHNSSHQAHLPPEPQQSQ